MSTKKETLTKRQSLYIQYTIYILHNFTPLQLPKQRYLSIYLFAACCIPF